MVCVKHNTHVKYVKLNLTNDFEPFRPFLLENIKFGPLPFARPGFLSQANDIHNIGCSNATCKHREVPPNVTF
jgi:hypothetical protein